MDLMSSTKELLEIYNQMLLSRRFNELFVKLYYEGKALECPHSEIGQEAVGVGACHALGKNDHVLPSHRTRSPFIIRGVSLREQVAGICGKSTWAGKGKVTTHHMGDPKKGIVGTTGIVGAQIPISVGVALACKLRKDGSITMCFLGDGASNRGDFHEGLNLAAVKMLPVIFVVENNFYSEYMPLSAHMRVSRIADRAASYGIPGIVTDGNDVLEVYRVVNEAVKKARKGDGPALVECKTYRQRDHCEGLGADGRPKEEVERWKEKDPLGTFEKSLFEKGVLNEQIVRTMNREIMRQLDDAVRFAEESPWPEPDEGAQDVYGPAKANIELDTQTKDGSFRQTNMGRALNEALREEMIRDENVILLGEDIGPESLGPGSLPRGSIWPPTANLCEEFPDRVLGTPISESGMVGAAVGAALVGMRPVVEIMYGDFLTIAMDQIVNSAAKMRYNYGGEVSVPLVVRASFGATGEGMHHSQSPEAWILNVPGLKIVMPSTPLDAKGLLKASIRDDDPVVFLEHKRLYAIEGTIPEREYTVPIGKADVKRSGSDISIVATALMVHRALAVADRLSDQGISIEVVDPRTLRPIDKKTILDSVKKTGRLIIVHEACKTFGFGAEIAAVVAEEALEYLDAPIIRIGAPDTPVPFSKPLEKAYIPDEEMIMAAAVRMMKS